MKIQNYQWVLFDADETLFSFDIPKGLALTFSSLNYPFSEDDIVKFQKTNKALWTDFQKGLVTPDHIKKTRFNAWSLKLNMTAEEINRIFSEKILEISAPLLGAEKLLEFLHGKCKIGIITNGFTSMLQTRLEKTGFKRFMDLLIVSEEVGIAKPDVAIFNHALAQMNHPPKEQVLMVGDTFETDILGGLNAGFHTCWLNHLGKKASPTPHYEITQLNDLELILKTN